MLRGFNAAMHVRNALVHPPFVMCYFTFILPDVLEGRIEPGRVFDRTGGLDGVPDGYRAMAGRQSLKVLIAP